MDNCNVPRIVSSILEVFARSVIEHTSELGKKLIAYVKFANVRNDSFCFLMFTLRFLQVDPAIISTFPVEQQKALQEILQIC